MTHLTLLAPLSGVLVPLDAVPDPVFAERLVGDGISIDPIGNTLVAPCDGTIAHVHAAGHALTIAAGDGIEILIHVGLDTVTLKGEGFTTLVKAGDRVRAADRLLTFDADYVALHARSLLTQMLVPKTDRVSGLIPRTGTVRGGIDAVLEIRFGGTPQSDRERPAGGELVMSAPIDIANANGLHARPAAVLAARARQFRSDIRLLRRDREANAKSVTAIMTLEVTGGDTVSIQARGDDAAQAVAALTRVLAEQAHDEGSATVALAGAEPARASPRSASSTDPRRLVGVSASPGLAAGQVFQLRVTEANVPERGGDPSRERRLLDAALAEAGTELGTLQSRLAAEADPDRAAIFGAHQELLEDPDLLESAAAGISSGSSAGFAWRQAVTVHADRLSGLSNALLAARAGDVRDVGRRVLRLLTGAPEVGPEVPADAILIAEDLTPSDTATLDRARVRGFCTAGGGSSSHVAILARALDIPAIAAIDPRALEVPNGTRAIIDGSRGILQIDPSSRDEAAVSAVQNRVQARRTAELASAQEPAITLDGHRVEVAANIGGLAEAHRVPPMGGEAVGLLRSEFLFLDRAEAPDEDEQARIYEAIALALGPDRLLVVRALDVGGDKPLPYLPMALEQNPFLGERGIRMLLARPEILRTQLRAILRASRVGKICVMFPMIATLDEWREARGILEEERASIGVPPLQAGIMVETASAALLAHHFAREADFFSIGTNDLTQYTLAMDRTNPRLAPSVDALHPAVLRLIEQTVAGARAHGRWVGVCGALASDPQAVPILIGLGVDELSVSVPAIPAIKAQVRRLRLAECREIATRALASGDAQEVRALVAAEDE